MDSDDGSNGLAAFPLIFQRQARKPALRQFIERALRPYASVWRTMIEVPRRND